MKLNQAFKFDRFLIIRHFWYVLLMCLLMLLIPGLILINYTGLFC